MLPLSVVIATPGHLCDTDHTSTFPSLSLLMAQGVPTTWLDVTSEVESRDEQ